MTETILAAFGIASAVLTIVGFVPYLRDILRHKTKPERATWWIWAGLNVVVFVAQWAAGAKWSLLLAAASMLTVGAIAVLSLWYGYGKMHLRDKVSLVVAGFGIALSLWLQDPLWALLVVVGVDAAGAWLTVLKSWVAPHTETLIAWALSFGAALCGMMAVGEFTWAKFIYPLYAVIACGLITFVIAYRRTVVKHSPEDF